MKIRGLRIELGEIEAALGGHPTVGEAVVVSREEIPGDIRLVGYVVARGDASSAGGRLARSPEGSLPDYMVPSAFVILPSFPLTPNGKIDLKALPAPERDGSEITVYEAPRTPTEEILAGIFAEVLRLERIGIHDDFFDLGGHSLLAIQLCLASVQPSVWRFPCARVFEARTVGHGGGGRERSCALPKGA